MAHSLFKPFSDVCYSDISKCSYRGEQCSEYPCAATLWLFMIIYQEKTQRGITAHECRFQIQLLKDNTNISTKPAVKPLPITNRKIFLSVSFLVLGPNSFLLLFINW